MARQVWGTFSVRDHTRPGAFVTSRTELTAGLPSHVTGVQAVPSFSSLEEATTELGLRSSREEQLLPGGVAVSILAHEFLVPHDPEDRNDDCLRVAVEIASDTAYRRKRAAFWRWLREYFDDGNMCHPAAIREAVEEMEALLEEQREIVRKARVRTVAKYAFAIGGSLVSFAAEGPAALAFAGSFISFGGVLADRLVTEPEQPRQVALLHDARRHFGWGDAAS